jgi:hypothetical protein
MLITISHKIDNKEYIEIYSDKFYITRDGVLYDSAFDPIEFQNSRIYVETNIELPEEVIKIRNEIK